MLATCIAGVLRYQVTEVLTTTATYIIPEVKLRVVHSNDIHLATAITFARVAFPLCLSV